MHLILLLFFIFLPMPMVGVAAGWPKDFIRPMDILTFFGAVFSFVLLARMPIMLFGAALSLVFAMLLSNYVMSNIVSSGYELYIYNTSDRYHEYLPLQVVDRLPSSVLGQSLYQCAFVFLFFGFYGAVLSGKMTLDFILDALLVSGTISVFLGLLQFSLWVIGADYLYLGMFQGFDVYGTNIHGQSLYGFKRINGGFPEPSYFAAHLIIVGSALLALSHREWYRKMGFFFVCFSLFSVSYTGVVGCVGVLSLYLFRRLLLGTSKRRLFIASCVFAFVLSAPWFLAFLADSILPFVGQFKYYSTIWRQSAAEHSARVFFDSFPFGAAFGSVKPGNFIWQVLSSFGLFGCIYISLLLRSSLSSWRHGFLIVSVCLVGYSFSDFTIMPVYLMVVVFLILCDDVYASSIDREGDLI